MAPAYKVFYPDILSLTMAAVRPTPLAPEPVVPTLTSTVVKTHLSICDLAVPGSPIINKLMSPLKWVPLSRFFYTPPTNINKTAFFKY
jgi:hypothetical protein